MSVRTRIAPSPTGDPHVGTAYIALFNLCFARAQGGQFILRIEDTDRARSSAESEQAIIESLRWLGLQWDEGPDVGGPCGPYRQSERLPIYAKHAERLLADGKAFHCYRGPGELEQLREARRAAGNSTALKPSDLLLDDDEVARRKEAGVTPVVRMMVPEGEGACTVEDALRGSVDLDWSMVDAQILLKSDGSPTYHLANVVDDHLMGITHVLRGEEWLNSAPKHQLLYEYFGWEMPTLCHLPLLRNPDKSKLSKRKNPTSIRHYQRMGYLPEAVLNYLGRMGWSMPDEREKFTLAQMLDNFDLGRVSLGGPVFDVEKLNWLNGLWIREELSDEQLADRLRDWAYNREHLLRVLPHARPRMETFSDLAPLAGFLVSGRLHLTAADFEVGEGELVEGAGVGVEDGDGDGAGGGDGAGDGRGQSAGGAVGGAESAGGAAGGAKSAEGGRDTVLESLQFVLWRLEAQRQWEREAIRADVEAVAGFMGIPLRRFLPPLFVAVCGSTHSFSVFDAMELLGPDLTRARLRDAIAALGGVSGKAAKRLEKRYREIAG